MYENMRKPIATAIAFAISISACASADDKLPEKFSVDSVPSAVADLSNTVEAPAYGKEIARLVEMAKANLAANLGIDSSEIGVSEAGYVTWRNSSIGCPAADTAYMDVLTHGSRIVLKAGGSTFHYHSAGGVQPTYCPKPSAKKPLPYAPGEA